MSNREKAMLLAALEKMGAADRSFVIRLAQDLATAIPAPRILPVGGG
jgi:hypothetical protein